MLQWSWAVNLELSYLLVATISSGYISGCQLQCPSLVAFIFLLLSYWSWGVDELQLSWLFATNSVVLTILGCPFERCPFQIFLYSHLELSHLCLVAVDLKLWCFIFLLLSHIELSIWSNFKLAVAFKLCILSYQSQDFDLPAISSDFDLQLSVSGYWSLYVDIGCSSQADTFNVTPSLKRDTSDVSIYIAILHSVYSHRADWS